VCDMGDSSGACANPATVTASSTAGSSTSSVPGFGGAHHDPVSGSRVSNEYVKKKIPPQAETVL